MSDSLLTLAKSLLEVNPEKLVAALPLLAPVVLGLAWYRGWFTLRMPGGGGGGGGGGKGKAKAAGGDDDLEPPFYLVLAIVVYFAFALCAMGLQSLPPSVAGRADSIERLGFISGCLYAFAVVMVLLMGRLLSNSVGGAARSWLVPRLMDVLKGIGLLVLLVPVLALVNVGSNWLFQHFSGRAPEQVAHSQLKLILENRDNPWAWVLIASAVLGAPIVEEFIYRGLLLRGALRASMMPWLSVLATSALFAAVHIGAAGPNALPVLFALAVVMAIAMVRTGRLGIAIGMHIAFNALNVLVALTIK